MGVRTDIDNGEEVRVGLGVRADMDNGEEVRATEVGIIEVEIGGDDELGEQHDEEHKVENVREQEVVIVPLSPLGFLVLNTMKSASGLLKVFL